MDIQEISDVNTAARCMALQDAAIRAAAMAQTKEGKAIAVELLAMARDGEPEGRDLELQWSPALAAKVDEWEAELADSP